MRWKDEAEECLGAHGLATLVDTVVTDKSYIVSCKVKGDNLYLMWISDFYVSIGPQAFLNTHRNIYINKDTYTKIIK